MNDIPDNNQSVTTRLLELLSQNNMDRDNIKELLERIQSGEKYHHKVLMSCLNEEDLRYCMRKQNITAAISEAPGEIEYRKVSYYNREFAFRPIECVYLESDAKLVDQITTNPHFPPTHNPWKTNGLDKRHEERIRRMTASARSVSSVNKYILEQFLNVLKNPKTNAFSIDTWYFEGNFNHMDRLAEYVTEKDGRGLIAISVPASEIERVFGTTWNTYGISHGYGSIPTVCIDISGTPENTKTFIFRDIDAEFVKKKFPNMEFCDLSSLDNPKQADAISVPEDVQKTSSFALKIKLNALMNDFNRLQKKVSKEQRTPNIRELIDKMRNSLGLSEQEFETQTIKNILQNTINENEEKVTSMLKEMVDIEQNIKEILTVLWNKEYDKAHQKEGLSEDEFMIEKATEIFPKNKITGTNGFIFECGSVICGNKDIDKIGSEIFTCVHPTCVDLTSPKQTFENLKNLFIEKDTIYWNRNTVEFNYGLGSPQYNGFGFTEDQRAALFDLQEHIAPYVQNEDCLNVICRDSAAKQSYEYVGTQISWAWDYPKNERGWNNILHSIRDCKPKDDIYKTEKPKSKDDMTL